MKRKQVYQMYSHNFPIWFISERTGYSDRHVRRIIDSWDKTIRPNRSKSDVMANSITIKEGREKKLWEYYRACGYSYDRISLIFGRSKQAIQQSFLNKIAP